MADTRAELFDHLEDILVKGWPVVGDAIRCDDLAPLMDTARALLMIERGVEVRLPKSMPSLPEEK